MSTDVAGQFQSTIADRYTIERELGRGGMGTVYLARDIKHGRLVALKVLRPELAQSLGARRFLREIEIAARLTHPHILPLHDSGAAADTLFYVMPYVEGESLCDRLRREKHLPVAEAVRIAREVASALEYAHEHGVVHRDIKPQNILLSSGQAVVADFGIARAVTAAGGDKTTSSGLAVGTPAYMSPEQVTGEHELDGRSDIYGLGCVLYEMLAGLPPFTGATAQQIMGRHLLDPVPSLRVVRPSVDRALERSVEKALAKVPADRFATAAEFSEALTGHSDVALTSRDEPLQRPSLRRWHYAATALLALTVIIAAVWTVLSEGPGVEGSMASRLGLGGGVKLDTSRYVVLPFEYDGNVTTSPRAHQLLQDALARWSGIGLVDLFQVGDALAQRDSGALTGRDARSVAIELGAGRYVRGNVSRVIDSLRVYAGLYDTRPDTLLSDGTVKMGRDLAGADSAFETLADRLLFRGASPGARVETSVGTRSVPARLAYARAHAAIQQWDLALADSQFSAATQHDPKYAEAFLWLAQVRYWNGDSTATWRHAAERAGADRQRLSARDQMLSEALVALNRGETVRACALWTQLTALEPLDFAAWYGSASCQRRDETVVKDAKSPSRWRFRSSYHSAVKAYQRAFQLLPSIHRAFRGSSYHDLRRLLFVSGLELRRGRALPPDTTRFAANPFWQGDSLAFIPFPLNDVNMARPGIVPRSFDQAIRHQRELFRDIAIGWASSFPTSPDAVEAVAVSLQLLGDDTALDTLRRARILATDPEERLRLAVAEVWMQVKFGVPFDLAHIRAARALSDSILRAHPTAKTRDPVLLASLAVLTGRAQLAANLVSNPARAADWEIPPPIARSAPALLVFSALGGPTDSLRVLERRVSSTIDNVVAQPAQLVARSIWLMLPASLAFPEHRFNSIVTLSGQGDYLLDAQAALVRGDTLAVRRALADMKRSRKFVRPADLSIDGIYPEAWLVAAVGDKVGAIDWLDPTLSSVPGNVPRSFVDIARAGTLVRAMAFRAELGGQTNDHAVASQWATIVALLWSDADPFLQPLVSRMERLMR